MCRKIYAVSMLMLLILSLFNISNASQPIGVAGYIYDENGHPIPNWQVNVTNVNKSITKTVYTNGDGLYAVSIEADDGDIIQANFSYNGKVGVAQTTANLNLITHWLNISLKGGQPPVALFTYEPLNPTTSTQVIFHDYSYDPDGSIIRWVWNFGDGTVSYEKNPKHFFINEGKFKVILMVQDDDGLWSSTFKWVNVNDSGGNDIIIPPMPPPIYPDRAYTVPEMYEMLKIDELGKSNGKVKVAVIDTGVTHREYNGYNFYEIKALKHSSLLDPYDKVGHGTWCNWAVYYGVATFTEGEQYSIKVMDDRSCSFRVLLDALNYVKKLGVDVVSISLGGFGSVKDPIARKIDELRREGIIVVCAGGNYGPASGTIITPALSPSAIAVGSVDPHFTLTYYKDDTVSEWSSRGPVRKVDEAKPDVVAGGESIKGAWLYGERVCSGTSMATPIVAGGCAVVYAKHYKLWEFLKKEYWVLSLGNIFGGKGIVPFIFEYSLEKTAYHKGNEYAYGSGIPQFDKMEKLAVTLGIIFIILPFIIIALTIILIFILLKRRKKQKKLPVVFID